MDKVTELSAKISSGGRLYKDAREAARDYAGIDDDDFDDVPGAKRAKRAKSTDDHPTPPPAGPPWVVRPMTPDVEPPTKRDWQEFRSTTLELSGIGVLTGGFWLLYPWLALVVLGICLVALGVAEGLPRPPRQGVKR